jgi:hypothetical protein
VNIKKIEILNFKQGRNKDKMKLERKDNGESIKI